MLSTEAAIALIDDRWNVFTGILRDLEPSRWSTDTKLPGWTTADLASHASWGIALEEDAVTKMLAGDDSPAEALAVPPSAGAASLVQAITDRTAGLLSQLRRVAPDDATRNAPMPYGPTPFPFALQIFAMEASVHTDDLAAAANVPQDLPPEAIDAVFTVMAGSLPVLALAATSTPREGDSYQLVGPGIDLKVTRHEDQWRVGETGARVTTVRGDRDTLTRFVMGRLPGIPTGLTAEGDGPPASQFKMYFPGP